MHDRLHPRGCVQVRSRGLFTFRKITDIISATVHDRDIVAMEA